MKSALITASLCRLACCGLAGAVAACSGGTSTPRTATPATQDRQTSDSGLRSRNPVPYIGLPKLAPLLHRLPVATDRQRTPATSGSAFIYAADYGNGALTAFSSAGVQTAQVVLNYPQGLATDTKGNLYVADTAAAQIGVWSPGLGSQIGSYNTCDQGACYDPADVAVDDTAGIIAVTTLPYGYFSLSGTVMLFQKGGTSPCAVLTDPKWESAYFAAFDDAGNLYVDGLDQKGATLVGVVNGGCAATSITTLTGTKIVFPGGIAVAPNDDILIDDQGDYNGSTVYRYAPPLNGAFGKPLKKTPLAGSFDAAGIAITPSGRDLWYADTNVLTGANTVDEIAYPKGGNPLQVLMPTPVSTPGNVVGVAVAPGALP